jgi:glycine oxidase
MKSDNFDLVVIGAGVIGLSVAFRIKQTKPQMKVAVVGDSINSLMASRAAAGMLAPYGESESDDCFFRFCRESLDKYPKFVDELMNVSRESIYLSMAGSIMPKLLVGDHWDGRLKFLEEVGAPFEVWSKERVREKIPYLSQECGEVIWVGQGQINNRQLHDALVKGIKNLGVELIGQRVTGFIKNRNILDYAATDSGKIKSREFVLAGGSWSGPLAQVLDVELPIRPVKGQMCRVQVEDDLLEFTVGGYLTYIAPWREGNGFVLGSTMEDRGYDPSIENEAIQRLIDQAAQVLPCLRDAPLIESWTGLRPAAEDGMPVMGKSSRYQNLFYSTGHFRNGILQTPNQADYMAGHILGTLDREIKEFSPSRYNL